MTFSIGEVEVVNEVSLAPSSVLYDGATTADGDLTVKVNYFYYDLAGVRGKYVGSCGNVVADGYTNYIYLNSSAILVINTIGYPAGVHIPLARVVASGGFITRIILERAFLGASASASGFVIVERTITTGAGLTGGGDLSADRTIDVVANADGSIVVNDDDIQVGVLATDAQHGERGGGTQHAVATTIADGFMSAADKIILDKQTISNIIRVAKSGGDFSSVKAAVDSITDATATNQYIVQVYPGDYTEDPFAMKAYVNVHGMGTWFDVSLRTTNNSAHFITGAAAGTLAYVALVGPTEVGYAAINYTDTGYVPMMLYHVVIRRGYYGLYVHPGSYGTVHCHELVNQFDGYVVNTFIRVTSGNVTAMTCSYMSGPPGYILQGFYATGATTSMTLDNCAFRGAGSTDGLFVDDGAQVRLAACTFSAGTNAIHIGSTGTASSVIAEGCAIGDSFTKDIWVESANAILAFSGSAHKNKLTIATGSTIAGTLHDNTAGTASSVIFGELYIGTTANNLFPLGIFAQAHTTTGVYQGGGVERVSGLQVKVLAGEGMATDGAGFLKTVSWADSTITLAASATQLYITVDDTGTVASSTSPPDLTRKLFQGRASTDGYSVLFLSSGQVNIPQAASRLWEYTTEVIGPINFTGGAVTKHASPSLQLDVEGGEFYAHNVEKMFMGAVPITFTYWYRSATAGNWIAVTGQTALDAGYYDDGSGTLAAFTSKYKRDLLFVSTNSTDTEYHVVYGQEFWDTAVEAVNNPSPPPFLLDSSCRLAAMIILCGATDIATLIDQRPKLGQLASGTTGVTKHGDLSGLAADDHTQYQLRSEKDAASGYAGLTAASKINVSALPTHASTHQVAGSDVIDHNSLNNYSANRHIDHTTVNISTTNGLQGGGDISSTRTLSPVYGSTANTVCQGNDARLSDARTPTAHATSHKNGGSDEVAVATAAANAIPKAGAGAKLDIGWLPTGSTSTDVCIGNDARLSDDRIASGLRSATTVVSVSGATAPTNGQVLTATGGSSATWQTPVVTLPSVTEISGTSTITTTSVTAVLMTGMTATPPAGNYLVWFGGDWSHNTNSAIGTMSIYVGGALVTSSERMCSRSNTTPAYNFTCMALVTVNGSQAIEGRWRTSAATATNTRRTLHYMNVT